MTLTTSKMCDPRNVSAQSLTTAAASCRSPGPSGIPSAAPSGRPNSVSSSRRRTVSRRLRSSGVGGGSCGVREARVRSHLETRTAHSKLQTAQG